MLSDEQLVDAQAWVSGGKDPLEWCRVNGIQPTDREAAVSEIMNSKPVTAPDPVEVEAAADADLEDEE